MSAAFDPTPTGEKSRPTATPAQPPVKPFNELLDAKAAGRRLGLPHTWVLAQARARRIPHHRLGHYVRFDPDDLDGWLKDRKITPSQQP
jgi:excisionase family DNA binding protein